MTNAEARFNNSLRPRKPEGSLGRTAQDVHLDSHTAPELSHTLSHFILYFSKTLTMKLTLLIVSCLLFAAVHSAPAEDPEVYALGYCIRIDQ